MFGEIYPKGIILTWNCWATWCSVVISWWCFQTSRTWEWEADTALSLISWLLTAWVVKRAESLELGHSVSGRAFVWDYLWGRESRDSGANSQNCSLLLPLGPKCLLCGEDTPQTVTSQRREMLEKNNLSHLQVHFQPYEHIFIST